LLTLVRRALSGYDPAALATLDDFLALDVRVGTIVAARVLRGSRKPSYVLTIDFGPIGTKCSAAQITDLYDTEDLVGLQVTAIVNLAPKRVAGLDSEVLVLAVDDGKGESVLLIPERPVPDGGKVA
jgi:tRNA-binding protein